MPCGYMRRSGRSRGRWARCLGVTRRRAYCESRIFPVVLEFPTCKSAQFFGNFFPRLAGAPVNEFRDDAHDGFEIVLGHDQVMATPKESAFLASFCQPLWTAHRQIELLAAVASRGSDRQADCAAEVGGVLREVGANAKTRRVG